MRQLAVSAFTLAAIGGCIYALVHVEIPRIIRTSGYTVPSQSSWKAITPLQGILTNLAVSEHSIVKKGQVVAELSAERYAQNNSVELIQGQLSEQKLILAKRELKNVEETHSVSVESIQSQLLSLRRELDSYEIQLKLIDQRLNDVFQQQDRQRHLVKEGFISQEAVELKSSEMLRLKGERSTAERQYINLNREIEKQKSELTMVNLRRITQQMQIEREILTSKQEINEFSSKRIQLVSAIDGVATQISAKPGQVVRTDIPLMTVIPEDGEINVILLVPSRSVGFIRKSQRVSIRYDAYPHEHYGRHYGVVNEISGIAVPPHELPQHVRVDEPVFTVIITLPANNMAYQNKKLFITPGMIVEADVELDRLKIYQWLLEPLYRLGGRIS